jgi:hypothetical protein
MSGSRITMQQVRFHMSSRRRGQTQTQASAKAGICERSARRIEGGQISVLGHKERHWRTRKDPFAEVWDSEVVPLLEKQPALDATTLFEDLQDRHRGKFGNGKKRTFQRLVSEVGMGSAGIVMGLEVSRLARNNADWHRLLEICALADTFREQKLRFPQRIGHGPRKGEVIWGELAHHRALWLLHHPGYAGAFCYGRSRQRTHGVFRYKRLPREGGQAPILKP